MYNSLDKNMNISKTSKCNVAIGFNEKERRVYQLKVIITGEHATGKSYLLRKYLKTGDNNNNLLQNRDHLFGKSFLRTTMLNQNKATELPIYDPEVAIRMCTDQKYPALRLDKKRHGFKIIITGEYSVGKSSLAMKYYSESNKSNMTKHDLRHYLTTLHIDGNAIELHIYDTAGQERYRSLTKSYYRGVHGCLIVFDTTKSDTFYKVQTWLDDLDHYSTEPEKISRIVVGTNCFSPEREIDKQTAQQFANHLEIDYMEVDIDYNVNVTDVFEKLTSLLIKNMHRSTFSHHQHNAEILVKDSIKGFKTSCIC